MSRKTAATFSADNVLRAREMFRTRIDSLGHDTERCFWQISGPGAPGPAFFPAVMYAFATLDYFSSFWAGWNCSKGQNQTDRMTSFSERYLLYPRKESQIAIQFWRHKLMHTAEPRVLRNSSSKETYIWSMGTPEVNHMRLVESGEKNKWILHFCPFVFVRDLREAIFGARGYFDDLRTSADLQTKYLQCFAEFESYSVTFKP